MRSMFKGEFELVGVDLWPVAVWWIDWSRISRSQVSVWSEGCSESKLFGVGSVGVEGGRCQYWRLTKARGVRVGESKEDFFLLFLLFSLHCM